MAIITGSTDIDDQHLLLAQACGTLEKAIGLDPDSLVFRAAWQSFEEIMEDHILSEGPLLRLLPLEQADAHAAAHTRSLMLLRNYKVDQDPGSTALRGLLRDVHAHMNSVEEQTLSAVVRSALAQGLHLPTTLRAPRRI